MHSITPQAADYFCASQLNKPFCLTIGRVVNFIYNCVGQSIGIFLLGCVSSANFIQHKDIQHKDIRHKDIQHKDIQHKDIQHNNK